MKLSSLTLTIVMLSSFGQLAYSQSNVKSSTASTPGILGYLDPKTGAFKILNHSVPDVTPATTISPTTGKLVANITIAVESAIPTTVPISCGLDASVEEVNSATFAVRTFEESASVNATRTSSTTASCEVTIPYSWPLSTPSSDTVTLSITLSAAGTTISRTSNIDLPVISVPANGATTTETVSRVL